MKVTMFHFMPYRDLPEDFPNGLASAWVDAPWWEYGDADKVTDCYNWSIDELMLAAKLGFDGVGLNEHHQKIRLADSRQGIEETPASGQGAAADRLG